MVKIENNNKFKVGDTVWWIDPWGTVRWGTIYEILDDYKHALIYEEGQQGACTGSKLCLCWPDKETCMAMSEKRRYLEIQEYKSRIKDVNDLVKFMYKNNLNGENPDYEARRAAKEQAKELLGLELED